MRYLFFLLCLSIYGCNQKETVVSIDEFLANSRHPAIKKVYNNIDQYEVQVIYSPLDSSDKWLVEDYTFQSDSSQYFYPASTVKLPVAVLALEFAHQHQIDINTPYTIARDTLSHTIADDVRQIFAVSDNEAYNRLYELLGRDYINKQLHSKGIPNVQIRHRLSTPNSDETQRLVLQFHDADSTQLGGGKDSEIQILDLHNQQKGIGYYKSDSLVNQPMDFSRKNYFSLPAMHQLMKRLYTPTNFSAKELFDLGKNNMAFLTEVMHKVPSEQGYSTSEYYDSYGKFFLFGDDKNPIPSQFKIYNKVGYAYGTLTETAFITNEKTGKKFLLSATILVNKDQIFNDDQYEYDDIGIPFLSQLGSEIYDRD